MSLCIASCTTHLLLTVGKGTTLSQRAIFLPTEFVLLGCLASVRFAVLVLILGVTKLAIDPIGTVKFPMAVLSQPLLDLLDLLSLL
jgi:hypothetical protein